MKKHVFCILIFVSFSLHGGWARNYGGDSHDYGQSVQQTTDGGFIIAGSTKESSFGAGNYDVYLIKTNQDGVSVEELIIPIPAELYFSAQYFSKNTVRFNFVLPQEKSVVIKIYDASGRYIFTPASGRFAQGNHRINVPIDGSGIYFYTVESENFNKSGKFMIVE